MNVPQFPIPDYAPRSLPVTPPPLPPLKRGVRVTAVFSWAIVAMITIALPVLTAFSARQLVTPATTQPAEVVDDMSHTLMARYLIGTDRLLDGSSNAAVAQLDAAAKSDGDRVLVAVVVGELVSKDVALERLKKIESKDSAALQTFYTDREATPDFERFRERHPYFADLATVAGRAESDPFRRTVLAKANRTAIAFVLLIVVGAIGLVAVLALAVTAIVLLSANKLSMRSQRPIGPSHHYIEGFAIYLGGFVVGSVAVELLLPGANLFVRVLPMLAVVMLGAAWPLIRGTPANVYRQDVGFNAGQGVLVEIAAGLGGYLACLPIVGIAALIVMGLSRLSGETPSHPIQNEIMSASPFLLYGLAAVFAPLTEELMFRGLMLANLRALWGVVVSGLICGFIFAAIHPQGWAAIPLLMSIGFIMALLRSWRGSLIAPIAAHALNNGTVITIMLLLLR